MLIDGIHARRALPQQPFADRRPAACGSPAGEGRRALSIMNPLKFRPLAMAILLSLISPASQAAEEDVRVALDAITVTAQRRAENPQIVPQSLSVIGGEDVRILGSAGDDILALGARAPSVQAESSFGRTFPRFYVRGLGNTDFDLNASQPVAMVYDDVVLENPTLKGFPLFDLDRVEVLRGPQGTLFGRNTPAGVLKFESVRPAPDTDGYLRLAWGRYDTAQLEGALGGAIGADSAARISLLHQRRDDTVVNTRIPGDRRGGYDESALRAQWLLSPTDGFEALLSLRARTLDGGSAIYQSNLFVPGSNQLRPDFRPDRLAQDARPELQLDSRGFSARLRWDFESVRLHSISAWESVEMFARGDVDGGFGAGFAPPFGVGPIPFPAESGDGIPSHRQLTQEFRLESTLPGPWTWQLGALLYDESLRIDNLSYDTLAGSAVNGVARQRQEHRAYGLYAAGSYQLAERWRVAGGLRYSDDRKDFVAERLSSPIGAGALGPIRVRPDDQQLSGDLSLSFLPAADTLIYARYANGFRAPAVQGRLLFGDVVSVAGSETLHSVELGAKADLWERRGRVLLTAYGYRVDDIQLTAVGGQQNFNTLINAEHVRGHGVEAEFEWLPDERWWLSAGLSWNHTEIDDPALAVQACGSPCTVLDPAGTAPGTVRIDGNPLPQAPEWLLQAALRYTLPLGPGEAYVHSDWAYRSRVHFFLYQSREFVGAPILDGGLRMGYRWADGRYEAALYARNLLDDVEAIGGVDFNNLTGFTNTPRFIGAEFSARL